MEKIVIWAPLMFGAMIGWLSVYFIRKYKKYNTNVLWKTAGMFLAGVGLDSLGFIISSEYGVCCILCYMLGCAIGFFAHWFFQFIISIISGNGRKSLQDYDLLSSCNLMEEERLKMMEDVKKEEDKDKDGDQATPSEDTLPKES